MQRKFLEDLGLEKETVDKIMDENGKDINREKAKADEYKTQLDTAKETLKSFEGVDVAQLQGKVAQLTADLANKDEEHKKQLADRDFNDLISGLAKEYKARDVKTIMPFLDVEKLKASKNQSEDIKAAFDAVKKDNAYLFEDNSAPKVISYTSGPNPQTDDAKTKANEALRGLFGKE